MKTQIIEIDSNDEKLKEFAESFNHQINPQLRTLLAISPSGEWLGYMQIIDLPLTISAWKSPGKDTIQAIKDMRQHWLDQQGGVVMTGCMKDSPFYSYMERLGFTKTGMEVFFTIDRQDEK